MKFRYLIQIKLILFIILISCNKDNNSTSQITFGANYHVLNCGPVYVDISVDNKKIGQLTQPCDTIIECNINGNVTKETTTGFHSFKIEITGGCEKTLTGNVKIDENECKKIFIDFFQMDWKVY